MNSQSTRTRLHPEVLAVVVLLILATLLPLLPGCGNKPNEGGGRTNESVSTATSVGNPETTRSQGFSEAQLAALTNQFASTQQAQAELITKLLSRIEHLESRDAEQDAAKQSAQNDHERQLRTYEEQSDKLTRQIGDLKTQVHSLESGRVLPEIALTPDDGPTTKELDQKIRIAQRNNELAEETAEARAKEQPRLSVGENGVIFSSADTNFSLRLRGEVQFDTRVFANDNPLSEGNDTFILRRARPIMEGTVFRDFSFSFVPDFGGSTVQIFDAWLNYRYRPELQLKAGKFKGPVGLEQLQADTALPFNERGLVTDLVPTRNVGVSLWGDVGEGLLTYSIGAYNVTGDGRNSGNVDFGDDKEFAARLFLYPFKRTSIAGLQGFGFGLGGSYSQVNSNANALPSTTGGKLPGYFSAGQQQFFAYNPVNGTVVADGSQWRLSPQLSYLWGPFGLLGEYGISHQSVLNSFTDRGAKLENTAWQLSAQWVLSGEPASFTGITPIHPFNPRNGDWGAWQLVGRFGELKIDSHAFPEFSNPSISADGATSWSVGVNWWLNKNLRVLTSFSHTSFDGGGAYNPLDSNTHNPPATVTAQDENVFFTRLQLAF